MNITTKDMKAMITAISKALSAEKATLNALDAELGDGDHGTAISIGFETASESIADAESPAQVLQITAKTLMNRMGGSSGALFGTLFLKGAMSIKSLETVSPQEFGAMWQAGLEGVQQRGKAEVGDKTMVDALSPAVSVLNQAIDNNEPWLEALESAMQFAQAGAQSTVNMQAKYGRAKYLGERAIGHVDAGAQSIALMFSAIVAYWKEQEDGKT